MENRVLEYVKEFIEETSLALYLDGKHELRNHAPYWIQDIYHFASAQEYPDCTDHFDEELTHELNPSGRVYTERVADLIYENLKHYKLFAYYYEIEHAHLRDIFINMENYIETYLSDSPTVFTQCRGINESLYDVSPVRPLPLSSFPVLSFNSDDFTPDVIEYEGLRRSLDSLDKIFALNYGMTCKHSYKANAIEILSSFNIPIDKNIEITLYDEYVELKYYLNGIKCRRQTRLLVYAGRYKPSYSGLGLLNTLRYFLNETINHVIGKAKEKNSETDAYYGTYPMKDLSLHGLKVDFGRFDLDKRLKVKEAYSINIIKESLFLDDNPVTSTSYGADSVLVQYLVKKVYPSIDAYHGKTGLDFPEIYVVEKKLFQDGIVDPSRVIYGKNKISYWSLVDEYGFNFERKGKRGDKGERRSINRSEKCCMELKHLPFQEAIQEHSWNINFAGLRADESRARELAAKRDGPIYFAKSWNLYRVNPIIFWTDDDVWQYTKKNGIPYASIYDMVLYSDNGDEIYKPRIGCWSCMLSAKYGYLKWLKAFKPNLYKFIMVDKGLLKLLYAKKLGYEVVLSDTGKETTLEEIEGYDPDFLMGFLEQRPCFFDETLTAFDNVSNSMAVRR